MKNHLLYIFKNNPFKPSRFFYFLCLFVLLSLGGFCQYEQVIIEKSNTVIDGKGGIFNDGKVTYLIIRSRKTSTGWEQTENVTIKNCTIKGGIRIIGMGRNGQAADVKSSSISLGHIERAQAVAPTNVTLSNVIIETHEGLTLLYAAPGTTHLTVENSIFQGENTGSDPIVYLDAESGHNVFRNNIFRAKSNREVIACDGSAYNLFEYNTFEVITKGGIYLYRNCGEGGTVRHQTPQHNTIKNNTFNLKSLAWLNYGVWLGSRNGNKSYCDDDAGYPFGSSVDNRDFADNNIVINNTFSGSSGTWHIKNSGTNNQTNTAPAEVLTPKKMTLTTSRELGQMIKLRIETSVVDQPNVWIDLNNNGNKDMGEDIVSFGILTDYQIKSQTIPIYGSITALYCQSNNLTALSVNENDKLQELYCGLNQLQALNVSSNTDLQNLQCNNNPALDILDVSSNTKLHTLYCHASGLNELKLPNSNVLNKVYLHRNNLDACDLDVIYQVLPATTSTSSIIAVKHSGFPGAASENPGADESHYQIATVKGWNLVDIKDNSPLSNNFFSCPTSSVVSENKVSDKVSLYPNPSKDYITLSGLTDSATMTIMSLSGVKLKSMKLYCNRSVDISFLPQGVYLVRINGYSIKLVRE